MTLSNAKIFLTRYDAIKATKRYKHQGCKVYIYKSSKGYLAKINDNLLTKGISVEEFKKTYPDISTEKCNLVSSYKTYKDGNLLNTTNLYYKAEEK